MRMSNITSTVMEKINNVQLEHTNLSREINGHNDKIFF